MKKLFSFLCALCVGITALAMPACSGGTPGGIIDAGGSTANSSSWYSSEEGSSEYSNTEDSSYEYSSPDYSSTENSSEYSSSENSSSDYSSSEYSSSDDYSSTENESTGDTQSDETQNDETQGDAEGGGTEETTIPEGATTYLARANELGSEVQNVPTPSELSEFTVTTQDEAVAAASKVLSKSGTAALASDGQSSDDYVDLTNPEENENYQYYLSTGRLMTDALHTFMLYGDEYVQMFKDLTAIALEGVVQFDTWIYVQNHNYVSNYFGEYRLSYDEITDIVTVEFISDNGSYTYVHITSTYNDDGKAEISGYILERFQDTVYPDKITSLNYVEDDYWEVLSEYQSDETEWIAYNFLCGCDLSGGTKDFFLFPATYGLFMLKKSSPSFVDMRKSGTGEDPYNYFNYMYNSAAEMVGYWNATPSSCSISFDIYELAGWDSFYYENETYYVTVNGEPIASGVDPYIYGLDSNYVTSENGDYEYWIRPSYSKERIYIPALVVDIRLLSEDATLYGAICDVMQNLGISPEDDTVYSQLEYMDKTSEVFTFDAFGLDGSEAPTYELYKQVSAQYAMQTITVDEAMTYFDEEYIDESEQTKDTRYFFIFKPTISGTVAFDGDSGEIDLSALTLTVSAGALGVEGNEYAAIIVATDGTTATELCRTTATYSGGSVTLSFAEGISIDTITEKLNSGEYTLKLYVVRISDGEDLKISDLNDIVSEGTCTFTGEDYLMTVTCGDAITIIYEEYLSPDISGSITASEDGVDLTELSVSLTADKLAVKGGTYATVIAAYDGTNLTELTRINATYINSDVTLSGSGTLSADDMADLLSYGSYTLKLYIVRATDGGDIVLSGLYDINCGSSYSFAADGYNLIVNQGEAAVIYEQYITPVVSGSVTVGEDGIDFSGVSITLAADQLIIENGTYATIIAAYDGTNLTELASVTATFTGDDITINSIETLTTDDIANLTFGSHTLKLYIARYTESGWLKLSSLSDIASEGTCIYNTADDGTSGNYVTVTGGTQTAFIYEQHFTPVTEYCHAQTNEYGIDFSAINVTLSAEYLTVTGGTYAAVIAAYDGTNYTEIMRISATYTGENIILNGFGAIDISEITNLPCGCYTIVLYIVRTTNGGDLILSGNCDISSPNGYSYPAENYNIYVTDGSQLSIIYEQYVTPVINGTVTMDKDGIYLSEISVALSADQLAVDGGEYMAVIAACGTDGSVQTISRISTTYDSISLDESGTVTISGFGMIDGSVLAGALSYYGTYKLRLYIMRFDGNYTILSGYYDISASGEYEYTDGGITITAAATDGALTVTYTAAG